MAANKINIVFFNFLRGFSPALFSFLLAVVGVNKCGKENWGDFVSVLLIVFLFNFIANWGNKEYLIRAYSDQPHQIKALFSRSFYSRSVFLIFAFALFLFYPLSIALAGVALISMRFVYSSFESVVIYQQKFALQFIAELVGFLLILVLIYWNVTFSVFYFLIVYAAVTALKIIVLAVVLKPFSTNDFRFDKGMLRQTIPFFLIGLSGWLHSKIDLYIVDFHLSDAELAQYQILIVAYLMLDAVPAFIVQPFSKHIYRLNAISLNKMRQILRWIALPIVLVGSGAIYLFLFYLTDIKFNIPIYLLMTLGAIPPFFFMIDIFILYRRQKERLIMKISFVGAAVNLFIGLALVPLYGVFGAVVGVCFSKWIMLIIPFIVKKQNANLAE